ncbi:TIGR02186 family protein [Alteriqipengyuania sp. 357]
MRRIALALLCLLALSAQTDGDRDPVLVPEVSQKEVQVRQGFTGTELLLFGAVIDPTERGDDFDIIVILKGPAQPIRLREKRQIGGIWMNAESTSFRSAPSYFAVASSRPIDQIVDDRTAAIFEFGTEFIQLSPSGSIDLEEQARMRAGLVDLRERQGLYRTIEDGVTVREGVLYQARIGLPSNVQTGAYTAETFAVRDGRVVASAVAEVAVRKVGFERFVEVFADRQPLFYGLVAILLSLSMGWLAGRLFNR